MRKSHKMILSLYIVLLMSLSMFCTHCYAWYNENIVGLDCICYGDIPSSGETASRVMTFNSDLTNNKRGVFLVMSTDDYYDLMGDYYYNYAFHSRDKIQSNIYMYLTNNGYQYGLDYRGESDYQGDSRAQPYIRNGWSSEFEQWALYEKGISGFKAYVIYSYNPGEIADMHSSIEFAEDIDFVNTWDDAKKFIIDGDDSVVNTGNPENNEIVDTDGNIPTPQGVKLYNDGQCVGLVWDNPKMINKLVGKYGDVSVEIKFRPTLNYNLDLFRSKTLTPTDYIGGITTVLSDHGSLYNGFMTLFSNSSTVSNKLDKYNIKFDQNYIFTDNILDTDYANVVCKMLGHKLWYVPDSLLDAVLPARGGSLPANTLAGEMTDKKSKGVKAGEGGSALDVGLKVLDSLGNLSDFATNTKELMNNVTVGHSDYMIRYFMMDGNNKLCSKWVNVNQTYDDNANATDEQSTNFKDVENNPVDNPNYNYPSNISSSSNTGDSWWTHFDDSTKTVFDSLSEQMEQLTESDGGFMQFFGELFATFPWLAGIFMLALSIALFLRIFGR